MGVLGISIYPSKSTLEEMENYILQASSLGYQRIFTSLLELAEKPSETIEVFKEVISYGNSLGMRTSIDVNPVLFGKLGISHDDLSFFKSLGVWSIRLDEGFTGLEESRMSMNAQDLVVELNISRGQHYIDMIMDFGADSSHLTASHNFYPLPYTGLDYDYFLKTANDYKKYNITTAAFVDSQASGIGPWPYSKLMVSTEIQRQMSIESQVILLKVTGVIDDIIISSSLLDKKELSRVAEVFKMPFPVLYIDFDSELTENEKRVVVEPTHRYRGDYSAYMIRSSETRKIFKDLDYPDHSCKYLKRGDITICNNKSGQYKGELQVVLQDRPNDDTCNKVATISSESLPLLDLLKPWQVFKLKEKT